MYIQHNTVLDKTLLIKQEEKDEAEYAVELVGNILQEVKTYLQHYYIFMSLLRHN